VKAADDTTFVSTADRSRSHINHAMTEKGLLVNYSKQTKCAGMVDFFESYVNRRRFSFLTYLLTYLSSFFLSVFIAVSDLHD